MQREIYYCDKTEESAASAVYLSCLEVLPGQCVVPILCHQANRHNSDPCCVGCWYMYFYSFSRYVFFLQPHIPFGNYRQASQAGRNWQNIGIARIVFTSVIFCANATAVQTKSILSGIFYRQAFQLIQSTWNQASTGYGVISWEQARYFNFLQWILKYNDTAVNKILERLPFREIEFSLL